MGVRGNRSKTIYTEAKILKILNQRFLSKPKYVINNLYVYQHESDYLAITKSLYAYEIEVKISRADFFNDFKNKKNKHILLENVKNDKTFNQCPNYFYYAVPKDLIKVEEVPEYAGLIYIDDSYWPYFHIVKEAKKLHNEKVDLEKLNLIDKFYYNMINWKQKAEEEYYSKICELKEEVKACKVDEYGNKHKYTLKEAIEKINKLENEIKSSENYYENRIKSIDCKEAKWMDEIYELRATCRRQQKRIKELENNL